MADDEGGPDGKLVGLLREAKRVLVFTGAGVSTASGIPDFRGPNGIWKRLQPVTFQDFLTSEEARVAYWGQKSEGWELFTKAQPNAVHRAAAALEAAGRLQMVVTQNIDGLHAKAGTSSGRLVELHGTNAEVECLSCGVRSDPEPHMAWFRKHGRTPTCDCGGFLKLATISFGQDLRAVDLERASIAAEACDLVVSLGSTLSVYPAAAIPLSAAERGVPYVVINRGETGHDGLPKVTLRLEGDVTEVFAPAVRKALS